MRPKTPQRRKSHRKPKDRVKHGADGFIKVTFSLRAEQVLAIEQIQVEYRARTHRKIKKAELYREAIDLLIKARRV